MNSKLRLQWGCSGERQDRTLLLGMLCMPDMASQLSRLIGCNVYVSEGRNLQFIQCLKKLCEQKQHVLLANTFIDEPYNRTGFTLLSHSVPQLAAAVLNVAQHSLAHLDLRQHSADHPRLGILDHISLHPLGPDASLQLAAQAALAVGRQLAEAPYQLPVYLYGAAHADGRRLADIRRHLGYFQPTAAADGSVGWMGGTQQADLAAYPPDLGPATASAAAGVVTVGAVPWVVNYNVPLYTDDMAAARRVAKVVSARGGGLAGVEAMALQHGPGVIEVATNLVALDCSRLQHAEYTSNHSRSSNSSTTSPECSRDMVQGRDRVPKALLQGAGPEEVAAAVAVAAERHGLRPPGAGYITNRLPLELVELARQHLA